MPERRSARLAPPPAPVAGAPRRRPVVLATMGVPVAPEGERMAIDSARETRSRLVLVNVCVVPMAPLSRSLLGVEGLMMPHEEALDEVRATAARAAREGVETLLLRVGTRHPARALLEVVREQDAGLLVLAPDPEAIGPRALRRLARRVCATAGCLVWVAPDGPVDSRRALL